MLNAHQLHVENWSDTQSDSTQDAGARPVDLVHLSRHTLGNRDLEREVLRLFHKQSLIYLERMRSSRTAHDWLEAAHTIKGSARGIGAWGVVSSAEKAEAMMKKPGKKPNKSMAESLAGSIYEANTFIEEVLADS